MTLKVGQSAPQFDTEVVENGQFGKKSLADYKGKWLVLFFYPLDFTFVCPTEILAFSDRIDAFKALGAEVLGVSIDSKYTHLAWINTPRQEGGIAGLEYPLASDLRRSIATDYGVLTDGGVALRGLFLIDPQGVVQHATINNLGVGRSVDETLRLIKAFQFVAKHGEVCPANWNEGDEGMKADPTGSKQWFGKHAEPLVGAK
jgi:peroxiredoxin (alkyl hydroperoxide reductase subunit C)